MLEWLRVVILGIVEGITEFLPISSTGHLIVASSLLGTPESFRVTFDIFIQLGAVVAVLWFYRHDIWMQLKGVRQEPIIQNFWLCLGLAMIPFLVVGFLLRDSITLLFSPLLVAISLIVGGVVMLLVESRYQEPPKQPEGYRAVTYRQALTIGLCQVVAVIPGVSRAAASIIGGMLSGMERSAATQFSFFLAIPTLGAATVYQFVSTLDEIHTEQLAYILGGAVVSGIVAAAVIRWLLHYVARSSFVPFAWYRIIFGLVILLLIGTGLLVSH